MMVLAKKASGLGAQASCLLSRMMVLAKKASGLERNL